MNKSSVDRPTINHSSRSCLVGCLSVLGVVLLIVVGIAAASGWWMKRNLHASPFTPVALTPVEQAELETKLAAVEAAPAETSEPEPAAEETEAGIGPYTETAASRVVSFTEKELNAMLASKTDFGTVAMLDLSDDLVSLQMLVPMEEGIPLLGGKTVRLNAGLNIGYRDGQPYLAIRGISLGGVPLPGAWWGDIKNKDLVQTFGRDGNFWDAFSRGVESLDVKDGRLEVRLRE